VDTVVAASVEDAKAVWIAFTGATENSFDPENWEEIPNDRVIGIWCDADGKPTEIEGDGATLVRRTAAEWATSNGRGFFCSTEN
jgi:hypothetical protein